MEKYFLKLVLNISDNFVTCTPCYKFLECHLAFLNNCLNIEKQIKANHEGKEMNNDGKVESRSVLYYVRKLKQEYQDNSAYLNTVKTKEHYSLVNDEDSKVKIEAGCFTEIKDEELDYNQVTTELNDGDSFRYQEFKPCRANKAQLIDTSTETTEAASEVPSSHKCEMCTFQTKYKRSLSRHMLIHKSASEVPSYKCEICEFQTKYKKSFQNHMLTHKSTSEVALYKCELCAYHTKFKIGLRRHMVRHQSFSEIPLHKCDTCAFQSKRKKGLQLHMLTHKSVSEVTLYKCEICTYQTKRKSSLREHKLTHQTSSEVSLYKCEKCTFQSKYSRSIRGHMLTHRTSSEVVLYKCERCTFQTKYKRSLRIHILNHQSTYVRNTIIRYVMLASK